MEATFRWWWRKINHCCPLFRIKKNRIFIIENKKTVLIRLRWSVVCWQTAGNCWRSRICNVKIPCGDGESTLYLTNESIRYVQWSWDEYVRLRWPEWCTRFHVRSTWIIISCTGRISENRQNLIINSIKRHNITCGTDFRWKHTRKLMTVIDGGNHEI